MTKHKQSVDKVRSSRAGHSFHERWTARQALQLIFPRNNLYAIAIEGLSTNEGLAVSQQTDDISDLALYFGEGDTFQTCASQQILQFKYKVRIEPVTSSYLKKTIEKFASTLLDFKTNFTMSELHTKLSFGFVTNASFSDDLWAALRCLKSGGTPKTASGKSQLGFLTKWAEAAGAKPDELFPLIEFNAGTDDLSSQTRMLRRTVSDWSANSGGHAGRRLYALGELVREKAELAGENDNLIKREDVLDALECDESQLFPAETKFSDVGEVVERDAAKTVAKILRREAKPIFLHADGGVGKTVFIQSLSQALEKSFEVVVFDCFGGSYRSETQQRHAPRVGLLQIVNELAARGLCDPLLPSDSDRYGHIAAARKRLDRRAAHCESRHHSKVY